MNRDQDIRQLLGTMFQAHPWHGIAARIGSDLVHAYIEIVPSDAVKYELDKKSGHLRIDRPQRFSSMCPMLYGFVPQTFCGERVGQRAAERHGGTEIAGDGDPLDICVLTEKTISHGGFIASVRPIGGLRVIDRHEADDKIIAVLDADASYGGFREIGDCPPAIVERLRHYFLTYKQQPGTEQQDIRIAETYGAAEAAEVLARSIDDYRAKFGPPEARSGRLRALLRGEG